MSVQESASAVATVPRVVCRIARDAVDLAAYHELRRRIFCEEQGLFTVDDGDAWDAVATPIVCVLDETSSERVIGVVRIYEATPGVWYGGRLGVDASSRRMGNIGRLLILKAVSTAHAWGCREFLAVVQPQNVPLFRRLHWRVVRPVEAHGIEHAMMRADLAHYPPNSDADVGCRPKALNHDAA